MPSKATPSQDLRDKQRRVLRREFAAFFTRMRTEEPGWPAIPHQQFVDALADSLVDTAVQTGQSPVAFIQTLVHELQDRVNQITKA